MRNYPSNEGLYQACLQANFAYPKFKFLEFGDKFIDKIDIVHRSSPYDIVV